jgi:uncharacterized BrkB/YihY/UPF0761 family membrane protein
VVVVVVVESTGAAGAGSAAGASVVVVVVVSVDSVAASLLPLPHDATKRPIVRANTLSFTNFIILFFSWLYRFIPQQEKGNPKFLYNFVFI